ncbi:phosphate ABC transporter permease PstA [Phototrophicus methaneseepsis]|nr:phosphate ABC transporter permease PstA [Phototrophicus methaneseepsis]
MSNPDTSRETYMPDEETFQKRLAARNRTARAWNIFYYFSIGISLVALIALFSNVVNEAFGSIAVVFEVDPLTLTEDGADLNGLDETQLAQILVDQLGGRTLVLIRDELSPIAADSFTSADLADLFPNGAVPEGYEDATVADVRALDSEEQFTVWRDLIVLNTSKDQLLNIINDEIVGLEVVGSWPLLEAIFNYEPSAETTARLGEIPGEIAAAEAELETHLSEEGSLAEAQNALADARRDQADSETIASLREEARNQEARTVSLQSTIQSLQAEQEALEDSSVVSEVEANWPNARIIRFQSWLDTQFITTQMSSTPADAGIRGAILGSLWLMVVVIIFALPVGVATAIYLNEYASDTFVNRLIETNVRNLAGVPSIIYGMLGLAVFVRVLEPFTSGALFGIDGGNGRTIMSAALTLGLLVLPIIIINAQEALRSVPNALREASFGMGATQWQTIWKIVLPAAMPGILTGLILSVSRAIGETAPLIVVGASTLLFTDPNGPFSKFTALPIQIFNWTARPQDQFRDIAAAAIIVLLIIVIALNSVAIVLRNRYAR